MDEKKYPNSKTILGLAIIFALSIVMQIFFGFGLFVPGTNNYIGYLVGTGGGLYLCPNLCNSKAIGITAKINNGIFY
ncbi:MAG: hypothetical protein JSW06_11505 [Thermoplasmatales archaeon]|nr:MAG: hypothetical protein JSW06_11505 [Thermoplasmatales archaeon]